MCLFAGGQCQLDVIDGIDAHLWRLPIGAGSSRKAAIQRLFDFRQPGGAPFGCARYDHAEDTALEVVHTAQSENTVLPPGLQRITKNLSFACSRGVLVVLNTSAVRACSSPSGTPLPESLSRNS